LATDVEDRHEVGLLPLIIWGRKNGGKVEAGLGSGIY